MKYLVPAVLGYFLGCISPAALFGKIKRINLRKSGTGNVGATNTALLMGKRLGFIVMFFDIFKGAVAVIISKLIFSESAYLSGLIAGSAAVLGHMYPFYMKFKGGKGLAAYGGMVLAYDPLIFLILFTIGIICMLIFNYCVALTVSGSALFPVAVALRSAGSPDVITLTAIAAIISGWLIFRHRANILRAARGQEPDTKIFIKKLFGKAKSSETTASEPQEQEQA